MLDIMGIQSQHDHYHGKKYPLPSTTTLIREMGNRQQQQQHWIVINF
ncbi:hypothetical protein DERF_014811 [Dermatophagoides farinae]|uniref:Uncharacterized protein n=1 Tax=Dermatophagoides farinae TaxID=6954 RepID=A0A922KV49_DERFA|nr:hypothetical protein DERF_014811 [Dermatophagoides farinae]